MVLSILIEDSVHWGLGCLLMYECLDVLPVYYLCHELLNVFVPTSSLKNAITPIREEN